MNCATPAKPSHPILANVLMIADVETQQIHLTVTDIALTIQVRNENKKIRVLRILKGGAGQKIQVRLAGGLATIALTYLSCLFSN